MRPFHIYRRHNGIYYAKAIEVPTGIILCTRSTGTRDRFEAMLYVAEWKKSGGIDLKIKSATVNKKSLFDELNNLDFSLAENRDLLLQIVKNNLGSIQINTLTTEPKNIQVEPAAAAGLTHEQSFVRKGFVI